LDDASLFFAAGVHERADSKPPEPQSSSARLRAGALAQNHLFAGNDHAALVAAIARGWFLEVFQLVELVTFTPRSLEALRTKPVWQIFSSKGQVTVPATHLGFYHRQEFEVAMVAGCHLQS
jgi:hypothetical protein